jgi:ribosomal subunit interface protein
VDIVITGRHTEVSERFRTQAAEKLDKITQLSPSAYRVDVEVSHERNPRQASTCKKVEITVRDKGPVIRAEAVSDEPYSALDLAFGKLLERLRRSRDRRKVHHGRHTPASVRRGADAIPGSITPPSLIEHAQEQNAHADSTDAEQPADDSPLVIRAKDHDAVPMTVDQALYEMELVGHDFFLFLDSDSALPSVVYRRRGWNYGVIRLQLGVAESSAPSESDGSTVEPAEGHGAVEQNGAINGQARTLDGLVAARP